MSSVLRPGHLVVLSILVTGVGCGRDSGGQADPDGKPMFAQEEAYELFMGRWSRQLAPALIEFSELTGPAEILDVGCGTGALSEALGQHVDAVRVTGVDLSEPYVESARRKLPGTRFRFDVGDAQQLPYADDSFDHALALLVINFIPDPDLAVAEMSRVTRPGGTVAAAVWDYGDGMRMLRLFWDVATELNPDARLLDEKFMPFCRSGELSRLWESAGLVDVVETGLSFEMEFESPEAFWEPFLGGQGPAGVYVASLDAADRSELKSALLARLPASEGPVRLPARAWAVRGTVP